MPDGYIIAINVSFVKYIAIVKHVTYWEWYPGIFTLQIS